jgi:hypothetical protein
MFVGFWKNYNICIANGHFLSERIFWSFSLKNQDSNELAGGGGVRFNERTGKERQSVFTHFKLFNTTWDIEIAS